jgi:hypothetical protein
MADHPLQIGEVATAPGVTVDTARYYGREGEDADCPVVDEIAHRPLVAIQKKEDRQ